MYGQDLLSTTPETKPAQKLSPDKPQARLAKEWAEIQALVRKQRWRDVAVRVASLYAKHPHALIGAAMKAMPDTYGWGQYDLWTKRAKHSEGADIVRLPLGLVARFLVNNPDNRMLSISRLEHLLRDVATNKFQTNGETVILASDGKLNDGQHRLIVSLILGIVLRTAIVWGVTRESRSSVDQGGKRTGGNRFQMNGIAGGNDKSAMINLLFEMRYGRMASWAEQEEFYYAHKDNIDQVYRWSRNEVPVKANRTALMLGWFILLNEKAQIQHVRAYVDKLKTGLGIKQRSDPARALREHLNKNCPERDTQVHLVVQHYNRWREGRAVSKPEDGRSLEKVRKD